ncbi:uncharacterized protein LOC111045518 [Nilaparvata lugens]|uniref:uncharacterized protein LOC111045518 n=1 Tax=Nilaparvata lugens TaxID=108931 RepID=UPI00193E83B3|nr:uncharacterized protein LOC111045518 [Nilaparvata lugens]
MMMRKSNWFVDEINTNLFIAEVEKRPELWDSKVVDKSFKKRQSSWDSICEIFHDGYQNKTDIERHDMRRQLQRRWKSLRDSFTREISKMKSTSQEGCAERKPYMYFKELVFLLDVVDCGSDTVILQQNGKVLDNDAQSYENQPCNDRLEETHNDSTTAIPNLSSKEQTKAHEKCTKKIFKTIKKRRDDGDRLFMLSLSKELKKVPDKYKIDVKLEILQAIMRGQKRALESEDSTEGNFEQCCN